MRSASHHASRMRHLTRRSALAGIALLGASLCAGCGSRQWESSCHPGAVNADDLPSPGIDLPFPIPGMEPALDPRPQVSLVGLAISPDGRFAAAQEWWHRAALGESDTAGTTLWDLGTGRITHRADDWFAGALAWSPQGENVASGGTGAIRLATERGEVTWTLAGHRPTTRFRERIIRDLAFSPDGTRLASASTDGTVRLWWAAAKNCSPGVVLTPPATPRMLAFFSDEDIAILDETGAVSVFDPRTGARREGIDGTGEGISGLVRTPEGGVAISHRDGTLVIHRPGQEPQQLPPVPAAETHLLAISTEGTLAVVGEGGDTVSLRDASTRLDLTPDAELTGQFAPIELGRPQWAPDGSLYVLSRWQGVLRYLETRWTALEMP